MGGRTGRKAGLAALAGALLVLAFTLPHQAQLLVLEGATMGTSWQLQMPREVLKESSALATEVQALLDHLDRGIFSTYAADSELSRFNAHPVGLNFPLSPELLQVLQLASAIHAASDGAFDPSVAPLVELWGFGAAPAPLRLPPPEAIATALKQRGLHHLQVEPATGVARKLAPLRLDLSGIAKGHAVDRVAALLEAQGIADYLLEIGGELRLRGHKADGSPWRVALESPHGVGREAFATLESRGEALALAASGDYRNVLRLDGKLYSHTLDPRSGWPIRHALAAVTVLAPTAAEADGWATALLVAGPEEGPRLATGRGLSAYFIMRGSAGPEALSTGDFARHLSSRRPADD